MLVWLVHEASLILLPLTDPYGIIANCWSKSTWPSNNELTCSFSLTPDLGFSEEESIFAAFNIFTIQCRIYEVSKNNLYFALGFMPWIAQLFVSCKHLFSWIDTLKAKNNSKLSNLSVLLLSPSYFDLAKYIISWNRVVPCLNTCSENCYKWTMQTKQRL